MTRLTASLSFLLSMLWASGAMAQELTFHAESNVVTVPVLVKDQKGQAEQKPAR